MSDSDIKSLGERLVSYCTEYNIPLEHVFEILTDQKVTPMIRGKAMEFNAYLLLTKILSKASWSVQKLNLNAQTGTYDEDISVTHKRTGIILKVESKSAVRGSVSDGKHAQKIKEPHFKVKCHRSRSNIKLAGSTNDRYSIDSFDILITNPSNAIFEGKTVGEHLEIVHDPDIRQMLLEHYKAKNDLELINVCSNDWRFCIPKDIAEKGFIPRTPYVKLNSDENWKNLEQLELRLLKVVEEKWKSNSQAKRRN
ncbi:MAG: hypothetical protein L0Y77_05620 [Chlorobi bacterium]|nr:hypothetical protein [Chlorobiota bacterium]